MPPASAPQSQERTQKVMSSMPKAKTNDEKKVLTSCESRRTHARPVRKPSVAKRTPRSSGSAGSAVRPRMTAAALVMPTAWTSSEKSRASPADSSSTREMTGNATLPPPMALAPATMEPKTITTAMR